MQSTKDVLNHHLSSLGAEDIEAVMEDYTEDSVILTPQGPVCGCAEIRRLFESFVQMIPHASYSIRTNCLSGPLVLWEWSAASDKAEIKNGVDTFVVQEGKITYQTVRFDWIEKE